MLGHAREDAGQGQHLLRILVPLNKERNTDALARDTRNNLAEEVEQTAWTMEKKVSRSSCGCKSTLGTNTYIFICCTLALGGDFAVSGGLLGSRMAAAVAPPA